MNKVCSKCGASSPANQETCPACGASLARTPRAMREAWQAYSLRKNLGSSGIWSILWGLLAAGTGAAMLGESGGGALIAIGLYLIGTGIAAWAAPGPVTLRLDALGLLAVGGWNIFTTLAAGDSSQFVWLVVGGVQIVWSIQRFRKVAEFTQVQHVSKGFANEVGALVTRTQRANASRESEVIEFRTDKLWKARLLPDMVVAVAGAGAKQEVRLVPPAEFDLQVTGEAEGRRWPPAEIRLGGTRQTGTVSPAAPARYADWRALLVGSPGAGEGAQPVSGLTPSAAPGSEDGAQPVSGATLSAAPGSGGGAQPASSPVPPASRQRAAPARRKWVLIGLAAALVVCVGGGLLAYRVIGGRSFRQGEAAYQAGDFAAACPALERAAGSYSRLGAPYARQAKAYQRECAPLLKADADRAQEAYAEAARGYQGYLEEYPAGAFVPYALAGLHGTYTTWSGALLEKGSYQEAIDVLGLAYAAYEDGPVPAEIEAAHETALYGLAEDEGEDGQAAIEAGWAAVCSGEKAPSQAVGLLTDAPAKAWFGGRELSLPDEMVATQPGHFRYAVCLEEESNTVQSCSYMPAGVVKRLQMNWRVVVRDTLTGRAIYSTLFEGGMPNKCPSTWTFMQGNLTGTIRGERPDAGAVLAWVGNAAAGEPPAVAIEIAPPQPPAQIPGTEGAVAESQATPRSTREAPAEPARTPTPRATPTPQRPTLEVWHNWTGERAAALAALVEAYMADQPQARLELIEIEVTDTGHVQAAVAAGEVDILLWSAADLPTWAEGGLIVPLTEYVGPGDVRETYIDPAAEAVIAGGEVYGLPFDASTLALIYNRDLLDAGDVPETTDALLAQARAWSETEHYFAYPAAISYFSACWFHGGEARWVDEDCIPHLDVPDGVAAAELLAALGEVMPPDADYMLANDLFSAGELPLTLNGPWALAAFDGAGIEVGVAPLPALSATGQDATPFVDVTAWMIGRRAADQEHAAAAWDAIVFLSRAEAQRDLVDCCGSVPALRAAGEAGWFGERDDLAAFYAQAARGLRPPPRACIGPVLYEIDRLLSDLWSGADPAEAIAAAQAALEAAGGED